MKVFKKEELKEIIRDNKMREIGDVNKFIRQMTKEVLETMLEEELEGSLGYKRYDSENKATDNSRNGYSAKKVKSVLGEIGLEVPRDRKSEFTPVVVKKRQSDISGLDYKIISMYAKGMTTRDIQDHIVEIYNYEISAETVSNITEKVLEKVKEWQNRALEEIYTIIYMDALVCKIRMDGVVKNKAVYGLIGIDILGRKDCLGLWISGNESSKYWLSVLTEIKNRGVKDVLIFAVDGLPGFPEAIGTAFPRSEIQMCIVHQVMNSLKYVSYKDMKEVSSDLKLIYKAPTEESGYEELRKFSVKWDKKYPHISRSWDTHWAELSTFFKYPEEIRRLIYTTNPIEGFNRCLRKISKNRGAFPNDDAVLKLFYLAIMDMSKKWTSAIKNWPAIISQLSIYFADRLEKYV